jgi:Fe-S cluster assembly ATP-binding protein
MSGDNKAMLSVTGLHATIAEVEILKGVDLEIGAGETHAIMGPNGAGKSTLANVLCGRPGFEITAGEVSFNGKDLSALAPHERAGEGLFLGFQYPVEIPGVSNMNFLRTALNSIKKYRGEKEMDAASFLKMLRAAAAKLKMEPDMLKRAVNLGFSGGEKKRNEMLQMAVLNPSMAVLDETDSGLDIDALKIVADGINAFRGPHKAVLLITHYQRLLDYVVPDRVHVMIDGRIVRSGDKDLARELEEKGYAEVA